MKKPECKIGEILVEINALTDYQHQALLQYHQSLRKQTLRWPRIPDAILKGMVYFATGPESEITRVEIQEAEEVRESHLLESGKIRSLEEILIKEEVVTSEDIREFKQSIKLYLRACPRCQRVYRLFNCGPAEKIPCTVCWEIDLVAHNSPSSSHSLKAISSKETWQPHTSPEFLAIYEILKRMEPLRKSEIFQKLLQHNDTVKKIFGQLTRRFTRE